MHTKTFAVFISITTTNVILVYHVLDFLLFKDNSQIHIYKKTTFHMLTAFVCVFTAHCTSNQIHIVLNLPQIGFTNQERKTVTLAFESQLQAVVQDMRFIVSSYAYQLDSNCRKLSTQAENCSKATNKCSLNNKQRGELLWYYEMRQLFSMQVVSNLN